MTFNQYIEELKSGKSVWCSPQCWECGNYNEENSYCTVHKIEVEDISICKNHTGFEGEK